MSYLRYDVYYASGDIDGEVPLPARAESGAVAVCVNGEHDRYRAGHVLRQHDRADAPGGRD